MFKHFTLVSSSDKPPVPLLFSLSIALRLWFPNFETWLHTRNTPTIIFKYSLSIYSSHTHIHIRFVWFENNPGFPFCYLPDEEFVRWKNLHFYSIVLIKLVQFHIYVTEHTSLRTQLVRDYICPDLYIICTISLCFMASKHNVTSHWGSNCVLLTEGMFRSFLCST